MQATCSPPPATREAYLEGVAQRKAGHDPFGGCDLREEKVSLGSARELPDAIRTAQAFIQRERGAAVRLLDLSARWRRQPPSEAQRALLRRKGIPLPQGLTRGQASWMIGLLPAHRDG